VAWGEAGDDLTGLNAARIVRHFPESVFVTRD